MNRSNQLGAALVVGLILLLVLTALAISGVNTATLELALANNNQYFENAFQAAESGIEEVLSRPSTDWDLTTSGVDIDSHVVNTVFGDTVEVNVAFQTAGPVMEVNSPSSLNAFEALHYDVISNGDSHRGATSKHRQGFYFIAPKSPIFRAAP